MKFIQFIGTQRSGSNLLRTMLNQLPEITAPHPPHILETFEILLPHYGEISDPTNFETLVDDVCTWIELNPVAWNVSGFDRAFVKDRCKENSLVELFHQIYSYYSEMHKSEYACCKSMSNVYQYEKFEKAGIAPYYIYLHRDGRDVACSFKKAIVGEKHVYHTAKQWQADQNKALEVKQNISSDRFIEIGYRDLITDPKSVLEKLCSFLNVPFSNSMLDYFRAEESINTARSGEMWKNLSRPIISENYDKYLVELTTEEIEIFESVAGDVLESLGYPIMRKKKNAIQIEARDIEAYNLLNDNMKKESIQNANKHDIEVRCPQKRFLNQLKTDFFDKEESAIKC